MRIEIDIKHMLRSWLGVSETFVGGGRSSSPQSDLTGYQSPTLLTAASILGDATAEAQIQILNKSTGEPSTSSLAQWFEDNDQMLLWHDTAIRRFLDGGAFWLVVGTPGSDIASGGGFRVESIRVIKRDLVREEGQSDGSILYKYTGSGPDGEVIGFTDMDAVPVRKLLQAELQIERFALDARIISEEAALRIAWMYKTKDARFQSVAGRKDIAEQITEAYSQGKKASIIVMGDNDELIPVKREKDENLDLTLKIVEKRVSAVSRVPTPLLGSSDNSKYSNLMFYRAFLYETGVIPKLRRWQSVISSRMCGPDEIARFDLTKLTALYANRKADADALRQQTLAVKDLVDAGVEFEDAMQIAGVEAE